MKYSECGGSSYATTTPQPRAHAAITALADQAIKNANLDRNAAKGDWRALSRRRIFWLFLVEVWELFHALRRLRALRYERDMMREYACDDSEYWHAYDDICHDLRIARDAVKHEAGDCVAFLAFLVDRV